MKYEPILKEVASRMMETLHTKQDFSNDAFVDVLRIFQMVFAEKIFDCMKEDGSNLDDKKKMIEMAGIQLRNLIHTYTGLDTIEIINNYENNSSKG